MAADDSRRRQAVEARVSRLRRVLNLEVTLNAAIVPAWVAATAFVMWRLLVGQLEPVVGALCFAAAALCTWQLARRRRVSPAAAQVMTDRQANAGGLLLTHLERPLEEWEPALLRSLQQLSAPRLDVQRPALLLTLALVFVTAGLLVPKRQHVQAPPNAAAATRVEELAEKLDAVLKEEPVDEAVQQELERLREELASNTFDAADWEAADSVEQQLGQLAARASAELDAANAAAQQLEEALAKSGEGEATQRAQEALERALMAMSDGEAKEGEGAQNDTTSNTGSQQQLQQLRDALAQRQQQLAEKFGPSSGSGRTRQRDGENEGDGEPGDNSGRGHASRGSQKEGAGVGRGGDTKELVFGDEAEMDPSRLAFEALPEGNGGEAGELKGLRAVDPRVREGSVAGAASGRAAQGDDGTGWNDGALRPKNRALVQRYFGVK